MSSATRVARSALVIVVVLVMQLAILPQFRVADVAIDLLLIAAASAGVAGGAERGAWFGFLSGLLYDAFLQTPFGLSALCYCLVGWVVGTITEPFAESAPLMNRLVVTAASALGTALFLVLGLLLGQRQLLSVRPLPLLLVITVAALVLAGPAVRSMRWTLGAGATRVRTVLD